MIRTAFYILNFFNCFELVKNINIVRVTKIAVNIEQIIPIIASCKACVTNDTGFGHLAANLNVKCLMIFCDTPPAAYALWNPNNIKIVVPEGETIESTKHSTLGKSRISFSEVFEKSLELIS